MSQLTRRAIVEATVALAQVRPLNKITVRDIVEACGITRNTFYYHFHDIYEALECAIESAFSELRGTWGSNSEMALFALVDFCVEHKKLFVNLYRAIGGERLSDYVGKQIHGLLSEQLRTESDGFVVEEDDLRVICAFYEEALTGLLLRWIRNDSKDPTGERLRADAARVRVIFDGNLRLCLENCRKKGIFRS